MDEFNPQLIKHRIASSIKDLDKSDHYDICVLIKMYIPVADDVSVSISATGTHIMLDSLDINLLKQLNNMILTKLQRIHLEQV